MTREKNQSSSERTELSFEKPNNEQIRSTGFKKAFGFKKVSGESVKIGPKISEMSEIVNDVNVNVDDDSDGGDYERYNPWNPTQ